MTDPLPRLHFVFAARAPVCVILRRGPSKWVHLIKWNTLDDSVEPGAWFKGRIYEEGCDLSPDGKRFIYFAAQYGREREKGYKDTWTAISKPPWLTALAMWPQEDTWGGRAYFVDNRKVVIDCPHWDKLVSHKNHRPQGLKVITRWIGRDAPEQKLPKPPKKSASFDMSQGFDQAGKPFWVADGQLFRELDGERVSIADFREMQPESVPSPAWAREW